VEEDAKLQLHGTAASSAGPSRRGELHGAYPLRGNENANLLLTYGRVLRKRRWTVLSVLLVILTVVFIATARETPLYRATAMVEIQRENPNIVTVRELFQLPSISSDYLATQYRILRSDRLARQVIAHLHLDQTKEFNPPARSWPWIAKSAAAASGTPRLPTDAAHEQAVLARFENRLGVHPIRGSRLVEVSFDSRDPQRAAAVVNALAEAYIQGNLRDHWEAKQQASAWLSRQLGGLKIRLEKSEDRLQRYAEANGLLFLESGKGATQNIVDTRLRQLQNELTQAQADRYRKESLYRLAQAGDYGALPGVFDNRTTQQLTVKLADLEVRKARLAANFTASYPRMKEVQSQIDRIRRFLKQQRGQAARHLADEYLAALHREALVRKAFDTQKRQANLTAGKLIEYNILKREVDTNKQLYQGLLRRLREAGVSAGLKASNIRVVDSAVPPVHPVEPRMLVSLAIASLVGLTFGVGLSLLQERLDNTLKTQQDVESFLRLPALALIPSRRSLLRETNGHRKFLPGRFSLAAAEIRVAATAREKADGNDWIRIDSATLDHSALAEAFRSLRTSVLLSAASRPPRSLVVLSAEPGEGKTTICANLAISLAQLDKRVLLVEGDMRRPCLGALFHIPGDKGLVHCLAGDEQWRLLVRPSGLDGLDCLACGPAPPNPSELLSSGRMQTLIAGAVGEYDFVLIDSPPLLNVADGRILATVAEGAILVARGGATPRELVRRARLCLADSGAHLIGVVLNDVDLRRDGYDYTTYAGYGRRNGSGHQADKA
jgi:succinoglycan biosynthesis transport protein ExoP